jgi:hypothetical protein
MRYYVQANFTLQVVQAQGRMRILREVGLRRWRYCKMVRARMWTTLDHFHSMAHCGTLSEVKKEPQGLQILRYCKAAKVIASAAKLWPVS